MEEKKCICLDMRMTGQILRQMMHKHGYSVRELQEKLYLSCPQSLYRWFNGQALPTLDNLYCLSKLFDVPMEDMLMPRQDWIWTDLEPGPEGNTNYKGRMKMYYCKGDVSCKFAKKDRVTVHTAYVVKRRCA